jgi:hypothetical protein
MVLCEESSCMRDRIGLVCVRLEGGEGVGFGDRGRGSDDEVT